MNYARLLADINAEFGQTIGATSRISSALALSLINEEYLKLCKNPFTILQKHFYLTLRKTLIATLVTAGDTNLNVTAATGTYFPRGSEIILSDGNSSYERLTVSSCTANTVVTTAGTQAAYAVGAYVYADKYFMPTDFWKPYEIKNVLDDSLVKDYVAPSQWESEVAIPEYYTSSAITKATTRPQAKIIYPSSGVLTADATTNTTTIVDAALSTYATETLTGAELYNISQALTTWVTAFDNVLYKLTVSPAITGQTTGSTYYFKQTYPVMQFYPITDNKLYISYYHLPTKLLNVYDEIIFPDEHCKVLRKMVLIRMFEISNNPARKVSYEQMLLKDKDEMDSDLLSGSLMEAQQGECEVA